MSDRGQTGRGVTASRVAIRIEDVDGPGGDFACSFEVEPRRVFCAVGDVTGHGPRAARFRVGLVARLEGMARSGARPGPILDALNREIDGTWPDDLFACLVCIDLDLRGRRAVIAVAGHLPPLVKHRRQARAMPIDAGPPVGTFARERYRETEVVLEPEAMLVVATDGIGDALMTVGDPLGLRSLETLVDRGPCEPHALCGFLFAAAARARGGGPRGARSLTDDATVLALKLSAVPAAARSPRVVEPDLSSVA